MIISIQQTLHGYQNGHQLLGNSMPLAEDASKILLYQSDLSGTLNNTNFESYLTGYPIVNEELYAFAKTWYANEMKRPGCVWTHTFLIKYSDLGKIPDLIALLPLFERPNINDFDIYNHPLELDFSALLARSEQVQNKEINVSLYENLYENPKSIIIIPSTSPKIFEEDLINLWSNQWPKLRRNFYFCTGALSIKTIYNKMFDVQVVPYESIKSIVHSENNLHIFESDVSEKGWIKTLRESRKTDLRRFLWGFGVDIEPNRNSYIILIELFKYIYLEKNFKEANQIIQKHFNKPKIAKNLKSKIYNEDSIISYSESEKEIVVFLTSTEDIGFLNELSLNLERRLVNLLQNNKLSISELLDMTSECPNGRLSDHFWDELEISDTLILDMLSKNYNLAITLLSRSHNIVYNIDIWRLPFEQQRQLFGHFYKNNLIQDWSRLTIAALEASSNIIFEFYWKKEETVINTALDWFNQGKPNQYFTNEWKNFLTKEKDTQFVHWLQKNEKHIHSKTFGLAFDNLASKRVINLNFSHNTWLSAYKKLKLTNLNRGMPYVASLLITIGFNNNISGSEWLVSVTFRDVYDFAATLKLDQNAYNLIPKDFGTNDDNDDWGIFDAIVSVFGARPKKQHQVESWDYCENLIRTLCNKTIRYNWNPGAFLSTLKEPEMFYRAVAYCATLKKGRQLMGKIVKHIEKKQIQFEPFQYQYLRKIKKIN